MLRGLDPLLTPDLLHALASMGHGDTIAVVDANFPAAATGRRLIPLPGIDAPAVLDAILSLLPIDTFEPDPVMVMQVVGDADATPPPVHDFATVLARHAAVPPSRSSVMHSIAPPPPALPSCKPGSGVSTATSCCAKA